MYPDGSVKDPSFDWLETFKKHRRSSPCSLVRSCCPKIREGRRGSRLAAGSRQCLLVTGGCPRWLLMLVLLAGGCWTEEEEERREKGRGGRRERGGKEAERRG
ncbi:hypothetical protein KY284_035871 [Solanum tuberosum]|uniref:Uncharacterized protein n=1 Tax=Solanum tuberosum TaxID=4113 RepID=M1BF00_SOLTU|nr:hypothetical protein KY284_035871 [Solanum tuberosum]